MWQGIAAVAAMSTIPQTAASPDPWSPERVRVSVVIPCLNEAENIERCVAAALHALDGAGLVGEVLVVDNASEDQSAEVARGAGARVVHEARRGYGSAYLA